MLPWQPFFGFLYMGAHWRHLANTTEPPMCGGDAAFCQITLTTCYYSSQKRIWWINLGNAVRVNNCTLQWICDTTVAGSVTLGDCNMTPMFARNKQKWRCLMVYTADHDEGILTLLWHMMTAYDKWTYRTSRRTMATVTQTVVLPLQQLLTTSYLAVNSSSTGRKLFLVTWKAFKQ